MAIKMLYAQISGEIISKDAAQHHHDLLQVFKNAADFAISSHQKYNLTSQKESTWSLRKSSSLDPLEEVITIMKGIVHSRHVALYEDWVNIRGTSSQWPCSKDKNSLWNTVSSAMAEQGPIHSMRNWFSHAFGTRTTSIETENAKFDLILTTYSELLPAIDELLKKLKDSLDDKSIWRITAKEFERTLSQNIKDRLATQNKLQARLDASLAKRKQAKTTREDRRPSLSMCTYTLDFPSLPPTNCAAWP